MVTIDWADSGEIKELHCGNKAVTVQCTWMHCPEFWCGPEYQYTIIDG